MREFVVRGIVEVMDDRQLTDRTRGMSAALTRLSRARAERGPVDLGVLHVIDFDASDAGMVDDDPRGRRRFFRFRDRARRALD